MKRFYICALALPVLALVVASCKKDSPLNNLRERKFRFQLYTTDNFSENSSVIHFSIFIRNVNRTFFDSSLATMQIKDIPDAAHMLVIEKTVLTSNNVDLAAGFNYAIDNVGNSWFVDTSKAGNPFKVIDFNFH